MQLSAPGLFCALIEPALKLQRFYNFSLPVHNPMVIDIIRTVNSILRAEIVIWKFYCRVVDLRRLIFGENRAIFVFTFRFTENGHSEKEAEKSLSLKHHGAVPVGAEDPGTGAGQTLQGLRGRVAVHVAAPHLDHGNLRRSDVQERLGGGCL